jgi:nitric oxide reductase large subunit
MILLQEGMAAGPYALILLIIVLAGIGLVIYIISLLIKYNKKNDGRQEYDNVNKEGKIAKRGINIFVIVFLAVVLFGLISLLKWGCNVKLD